MNLSRIVVIIILTLPVILGQYCPSVYAQQTTSTRTVLETGFEDGLQNWTVIPNVTALDTNERHQGRQSLRFTNTNPASYKLFTRRISAQPGEQLQMSVWVKGRDVASSKADKGAGIFLEARDANGKWIDGAYSRNLAGTFDWQRIEGKFSVPPQTASVMVGLYLRSGTVGTAWFDDLAVTAQVRQPIRGFLAYPNYRGLVPLSSTHPWQANLEINALPQWNQQSLTLKSTLRNAAGQVVGQEIKEIPASRKAFTVSVAPPRENVAQKYEWSLEAFDPTGKNIKTLSYEISVVAEMPQVYIDAEGFTIIEGTRFFPLGIYGDPVTEEHLKRISEAGFNTVLSYGYGQGKDPQAYLDASHRQKLKVIYSIKDFYPGLRNAPKGTDDPIKLAGETITALREHPALLAWYINDEMYPEAIPKLERMYTQVKKLDPQHLAYQVLYQTGGLDQYFHTTDAIGTDPYPLGEMPDITRTGINTRIVNQSMHGAKANWMVPQIFDWAVYKNGQKSHQPTLDEMRNQAYQAIINGARGLMFYSYFDLWYDSTERRVRKPEVFEQRWPAVAEMAGEIKALLPTIMHNRKVALTLPSKARVEAGAWEFQNELWILLANPYYTEEKIVLTLPQGWKIQQTEQGQIKSAVQGTQATFTLPAVGSGVFRLVK